MGGRRRSFGKKRKRRPAKYRLTDLTRKSIQPEERVVYKPSAEELERGRALPKYRKRVKYNDPNYRKPTSWEEHSYWRDWNTPVLTQLDIVTRDLWQAAPPCYEQPLARTPAKVLVFYTGENGCYTREECAKEVRRLQTHYMEDKKLPDIPYNFLIGTDAIVYEGRGWGINPTKVHKLYRFREYHGKSIDIAFMGPWFKSKNDNRERRSYWPKDSFLVPMRQTLYNLVCHGLGMGFVDERFGLHAEVNI